MFTEILGSVLDVDSRPQSVDAGCTTEMNTFVVADISEEYYLIVFSDSTQDVEIPIPKQSREYSTVTQEQLNRLEKGDMFESKLQLQNSDGTEWRVLSVNKL